jgi:serine/threonine-protein kinase RsbW
LTAINTLALSSRCSNIASVEQFIRDLFLAHNIREDRFPDVLITLTEAVNNAIIHGNLLDERKNVLVRYFLSDNKLTFLVADEGHGFDPSMVPDPTCSDNIENCGGRGVKIMATLADYFCYKENGSLLEIGFNI